MYYCIECTSRTHKPSHRKQHTTRLKTATASYAHLKDQVLQGHTLDLWRGVGAHRVVLLPGVQSVACARLSGTVERTPKSEHGKCCVHGSGENNGQGDKGSLQDVRKSARESEANFSASVDRTCTRPARPDRCVALAWLTQVCSKIPIRRPASYLAKSRK